jgi:transcriptional regulator with PAS, ATPase and Fis domain
VSTALIVNDESKDVSERLYLTWHNYVEKGIIEQDLSPYVVRSWQRSRSVDPNIDPYKLVLSENQIEEKRADSKNLISIATPIMQDICSLGGQNFVMLCDINGYVLEAVSNVDFPLPLGVKCQEKDIGTNAIGIAFIEDNLIAIKGYEHYSSHLHPFSCIAVPIHNPNGKIIGAINITNPYGKLETGIIGLMKMGVSVIERQLNWNRDYFRQKEEVRTLNVLKDTIEQSMLVFDQGGKVFDVNQKCVNLLGLGSQEEIIGVHYQDVFKDESNIPNSYSPGSKLELMTHKSNVPVKIVKNVIIKDLHGTAKTLLLFEPTKRSTDLAISQEKHFYTFDDIVGKSQIWTKTVLKAKKAAQVFSNVLIEGESGTGKELIAQAIHFESRRSGPFIPINCGAIPKELIESELFGYEEGAFTGARKGGMKGKFEMADNGTLFLDEIGEMPLVMQVRLLRFLQDKALTRVGGTKSRVVNVRIIAATNRDLKQEIKDGRFREDLYFRLNVISIKLPSLRQRKDDIPPLVNSFLTKYCQQLQKPIINIDGATMKALQQYDWPGNVRELSNIIENSIVFAEGNVITPEVLPSHINEYVPPKPPKGGDLKKNEKLLILETLEKYQGNITRTAKELGIARNTIYYKLRQWD